MDNLEKMKIKQGPIGVFFVRGLPKRFNSKEAAEQFKAEYIAAAPINLEKKFPMGQNITFEYRKIGDAYYGFNLLMMYELKNGTFVIADPEDSISEAQETYDNDPQANEFFQLRRSSD